MTMNRNSFLAGERVMLRPLEEEDFSALNSWLLSLDLRRALNIRAVPRSSESENRETKSLIDDPRNAFFAIEHKESGEHVGNIALSSIDWINRNSHIGVFLKPGLRRSGLGTEAMFLMLKYAFGDLGLWRVQSGVDESNRVVLNLVKRLGGKVEGRAVQAAFYDRAFHDILYIAFLAPDFWAIEATIRGAFKRVTARETQRCVTKE